MIGRRRIRVSAGQYGDDVGVRVENLRIDFEITKYVGSSLDIGRIDIYNMAESTRRAFLDQFTNIWLEFGYGERLSVLFIGEIYSAVVVKKNGTDIVTSVYVGSGIRAHSQATINKTIGIGTSMPELVKAITSELQSFGVSIGVIDERLADIDAPTGRGLTLSGTVKDTLDMVLKDTGFDWTITDGQVSVEKQEILEASDIIITPASGLIGAVRKTDAGYDFTTICNPAIVPGRTIGVFADFVENNKDGLNFIRSRVDSGGYVSPIGIVHKGTNWDGPATTDVTGLSS